jgi:hypothetical protein
VGMSERFYGDMVFIRYVSNPPRFLDKWIRGVEHLRVSIDNNCTTDRESVAGIHWDTNRLATSKLWNAAHRPAGLFSTVAPDSQAVSQDSSYCRSSGYLELWAGRDGQE